MLLANFKPKTTLATSRGSLATARLSCNLSLIRPVLEWFGTMVCPRPSVKVWKLYSAAPFVSSSQLPLACHIFLLWATHKLHLATLAVKKEINNFSGTCLTVPLVFSPYCHHPETALLLLESDLQQSTLDQLLEQNVIRLRSSTVC